MNQSLTTLEAARAAFAVYLGETRLDFPADVSRIVTKTTMEVICGRGVGKLTIYALDPASGSVLDSTSCMLTLCGCGPPIPSNDDFPGSALPTLSPGTSFDISGNEYCNGSREPGEPLHAGRPVSVDLFPYDPVGCSVWWYWNAPGDLDGSRHLRVTTGTNPYNTDPTLVAVYTGDSVDALTEVVSNGDGLQDRHPSTVDFVPVAGVRYHIAAAATQPYPIEGDCPDKFAPCNPPPVYIEPVFSMTVKLYKPGTDEENPPKRWGCVGTVEK